PSKCTIKERGARIRARYESAISHAVCAYTAVTSEQRSPSTLSFEANWPPLPPVAPTQEGLGVPRAPGTLERPADANHWRQGCASDGGVSVRGVQQWIGQVGAPVERELGVRLASLSS
ncbi:hypothetical protein PSTT_05494, partial [Puccinia striiformis]